MNNQNEDIRILAKTFEYLMGNPSVTGEGLINDMTISAFKKMADRAYRWTPMQREQVKMLIEMYGMRRG